MAFDRQARGIWIEQCRATRGIKERFGVQAAFDYIVSEKLLNFADVAGTRAEFARELPLFVAEVRRIFMRDDIGREITRLDADLEERAEAAREHPDEELLNDAARLRRRRERLQELRQVLIAP